LGDIKTVAMKIPDGSVPITPVYFSWEVVMKAKRAVERSRIRDLMMVGLSDDALADQSPRELRPRLEEIRANLDG
jgi:hypothetical protein